MSEIAVIGAGAWGTSLSIVLGRKGTHRVRLWAHEKEVRDSISSLDIAMLEAAFGNTPFPEPSTFTMLLGLGGTGLVIGAIRRRRKLMTAI